MIDDPFEPEFRVFRAIDSRKGHDECVLNDVAGILMREAVTVDGTANEGPDQVLIKPLQVLGSTLSRKMARRHARPLLAGGSRAAIRNHLMSSCRERQPTDGTRLSA